jgi:hypothetical protein
MAARFPCRLHPITLKAKCLFEWYFSQYPPQISELTFTNLFGWAETYHTRYCEHENHLLVSYGADDDRLHLLPPIGPDPLKVMRSIMAQAPHHLWIRIPESIARKTVPFAALEEDPASHDYVYRLSELRELSGKRFDGKRNHIRHVQEQDPHIEHLLPGDVPACEQVLDAWLSEQKNHWSALQERSAIKRTLQNFVSLPLHGIGMFLGGTLAGFAIGEPLNADTFVEHFEKGLPGISGLYPFLLHSFALSVPEPFTFLNREQDLGLEGLRRSKESWHPEFLLRKFTLHALPLSQGEEK